MKNLGLSYAKLMKNLRRHYYSLYRYLNENVKFAASAVILESGNPLSEAVIG